MPERSRVAGGVLALCLAGRVAAAQPAAPEAAPARPHPWNELATSWIALQLHATAMVDGAFFVQDAASVVQVGALNDTGEFRLGRLQVDGQLTAPFPWSFEVTTSYNGLDQNSDTRGWAISNLKISIPLGRFVTVTLGEQPSGVGLERLAEGENLAFMERSTMTSAFKRSNDLGVRFTGTAAHDRLTWSAGWYNNWLTDGLSFDESGNSFAGRVTGLPLERDGGRALLHLGVWGAWQEAQGGMVRSRSRPEVYEAPDFVDTGEFAADHGSGLGFELAAVEGPVTLTAEYTLSDIAAPSSGDPRFEGWYAAASWAITGETRPYDHAGGYFGQLTPAAPFSLRGGGAGAWEIAARYSWIDLDGGSVAGGKFDRWSGALSWYPTRNWRFEFDYGYGRLERSGATGRTSFYQLRLQFEI